MDYQLLSKDKSLCNLANSILKYFNCETYHDSIKHIDDVLKKSGKKKICLFLFDGFGKAILEKHKEYAPYMYEHIEMEIESVFPATTVACTTAVTTGKYPIETAFIGWHEYFKEYDEVMTTFSSICKGNEKRKINPLVSQSIIKPHFIDEIINEKYGEGSASLIHNFRLGKGIGKLFMDQIWEHQVDKALDTQKFVYAYNWDPDHLMHKYGTNNFRVKNKIKYINRVVKRLTTKHKDVLFIAISDHGMMDVKWLYLSQFPGLTETLKSDKILLEGRFSSFFVKDKKKFIEIYKNTPMLYKNFALLTKEEILEKKIFGYSDKINKYSNDTLGDLFLISHSKYCLADRYQKDELKGHHAGQTEDEYKINLQIYNK